MLGETITVTVVELYSGVQYTVTSAASNLLGMSNQTSKGVSFNTCTLRCIFSVMMMSLLFVYL